MRILLNSSVSMLEASESDILGFIFFNLLSLSWFLLICKNWVTGSIQWWLGCIFSWFWLVCNHACSRSKHGWLACRGVGCLTKHGLGFRYESSARVHKISRLIWRFWAKWTCSERANNFYLIGVFFLVCSSFCHWCLSLANAKSTRLRLSKKRSSWHILSLRLRFKKAIRRLSCRTRAYSSTRLWISTEDSTCTRESTEWFVRKYCRVALRKRL